MTSGKKINLHIAPADKDWEQSFIPIRIPIRRGLLNYRLLLTHKENTQAFKSVRTFSDIQKFTVGLRNGWTTTKVMRALGFNIVGVSGYDSLFLMLDRKRFDYIPRGVNEIFGEIRVRADELKLAIVPGIALKMPMPVYIYVSPKHPRLADRIKAGFEIIMGNGKFDKLFEEYFGYQIRQAKLYTRHIIDVGNPLLSKETPFDQKNLWVDQFCCAEAK